MIGQPLALRPYLGNRVDFPEATAGQRADRIEPRGWLAVGPDEPALGRDVQAEARGVGTRIAPAEQAADERATEFVPGGAEAATIEDIGVIDWVGAS